jgi:hypothetical protein
MKTFRVELASGYIVEVEANDYDGAQAKAIQESISLVEGFPLLPQEFLEAVRVNSVELIGV